MTVARLVRAPTSAQWRLRARLAPHVSRMLGRVWPEDQLRQLQVRLVNTATTHISLTVVELVVEVSTHHSAESAGPVISPDYRIVDSQDNKKL